MQLRRDKNMKADMFNNIRDTDVKVYAAYSQSSTAAIKGEVEEWDYVARVDV